jgi:hypothetical protein
MLTVGQNLDRTGQPLLIFATLILSKLFLTFSHLFPLYSDYSYLFLLKINVDFTPWNPTNMIFLELEDLRQNLKLFSLKKCWLIVLMINA